MTHQVQMGSIKIFDTQLKNRNISRIDRADNKPIKDVRSFYGCLTIHEHNNIRNILLLLLITIE